MHESLGSSEVCFEKGKITLSKWPLSDVNICRKLSSYFNPERRLYDDD